MINPNRYMIAGDLFGVIRLAYSWVWLVILLSGPAISLAQDTGIPSAYIVGSGNTALDDHVTRLLTKQLGDHVVLEFLAASHLPVLKDKPVITIGPVAFSKVRQANRNTPVLALLVKKDFIEAYTARSRGRISAVYYDAPLLQQALTGKAILPQATRVALLATTATAELYEPLLDQLAPYGLEARVFISDTDDQLIPTLIRALSYGDFLLAGPDNAIYNPRNIKHILLTAYRRNKILIGPSQAYVKAGALASSYAPFNEMVKHAGNHLMEYFQKGSFPAPIYPDEYRVEVNEQVARSLNIPLPERDRIAQAVKDMILNNNMETGQ